MAPLIRAPIAALSVALIAALLIPAWLLLPGSPAHEEPAATAIVAPILVPPRAQIAGDPGHSLFAVDVTVATGGDAPDAPRLVGVIGRLGVDAVALVRRGDGTTQSVAVGGDVDGWRMASLAADAAFFTRGTRRVRVAIPGAPTPESEDPSALSPDEAIDQ